MRRIIYFYNRDILFALFIIPANILVFDFLKIDGDILLHNNKNKT